MTLLKLDIETLFKRSEILDVAESPRKAQQISARFQEQTAQKDSPFFSGYRRQILSSEGLKESRQLADKLRASFDTLLVLGIGGSALGTRAILESLKHTIPAGQAKQIRIIDNLDPIFFARETAGLDWKKTAVAVISKSGGTIETMAQFAWVLKKFADEKLELKNHVVAITDPKSGVLRKWVAESKVQALEVPSDVGGRFSVFTPVGLLPLAFAGLSIEKLISGAQKQIKDQSGVTLKEIDRLAKRLCDYEDAGVTVHNLFLYSTVMRECGAWFVQLWGESLGKIHPQTKKSLGTFPITSVGATDQHSILQLLMEGRRESLVGFLKIRDWKSSDGFKMLDLPAAFGDGLSFAKGKSFEDILNGEAVATQQALEKCNRPVYSMELALLNEECIGAWMTFMMDLTSATGAVQGVNPYDQPGVEIGKKILKEIL